MSLGQNIILSLFDGFFYILIIWRLLSQKMALKKVLLFGLLLGLFSGVFGFFMEGTYASIFLAVVIIIYIILIFREDIISSLYLYSVATVLLVAFQILAMLPFIILYGQVEYIFVNGFIAQTIGLILVLLTIRYVHIEHIYYYIKKRHKTFSYIVVNAYTIVFLMLIYWNMNRTSMFDNMIAMFSIIFVILLVNVILINNSLKDQKMLEQIKVNEQYMPIIDQLMMDIRKKQHDYHNHLQALQMIVMTSESAEDAKAKMEKYGLGVGDLQGLDVIAKLENRVVAGFLYSKVKQVQENGQKLEVMIKTQSLPGSLLDHEWIESLGILIDNAMEASEPESVIQVAITKKGEECRIDVKNPHAFVEQKLIKQWFESGYSSKGEARGFGLAHLKKTVHQQKGHVSVNNVQDEDTNYIEISVTMPY